MSRCWVNGLGLGLAVAGLYACNPESVEVREPHAATGDSILGGVEDPGDPAVVALFGHLEGETSGSLCTATVVSPTVLLTAAHCVHPDIIGPDRIFNVIFGTNIRGAPRADVIETHYDPAFNPRFVLAGHDIAVAILAEPVTIDPIPYNRRPMTDDMVDQPARMIGYGMSDRFDQATAGTKRQATSVLRSISANLIRVGTRNEQTCSGDSGGPALMDIDGVETVVGVTSFGFIYCSGDGGYDTRVDVLRDFVDAYVTPGAGGGERSR